MADGGWRMADGGWRMTDDKCEVRSGGCGDGHSGETTPQAPSDEMSPEDWDLVYGPSLPRSRATMIAGIFGWLWGRRTRAQRADARGVPDARKGAKRSQTGINAKLVAA